MSDTAVICYIAGARLGSYELDLFEACYAVWYEKVEWRHLNRSGDCWGKVWQVCACRPIAAGIRDVLHFVPKEHHLIIKVKDKAVVDYINGRVRERSQPGWTDSPRRGGEELLRDLREVMSGARHVPRKHDCEVFMGDIVSGIQERCSAGVMVDIVRAHPSEEQDRRGVNAAQDLARWALRRAPYNRSVLEAAERR